MYHIFYIDYKVRALHILNVNSTVLIFTSIPLFKINQPIFSNLVMSILFYLNYITSKFKAPIIPNFNSMLLLFTSIHFPKLANSNSQILFYGKNIFISMTSFYKFKVPSILKPSYADYIFKNRVG